MTAATGLIYPNDGDTINPTDETTNLNILKNSVNNVANAQITNDTITNAKINSAAGIEMSKITGTASDALLSNAMENFIEGCWVQGNGATIDVNPGSVMINGELRRITSAIQTNPGTDPGASDWLDVWAIADTAASTFTVTLVDSATVPGGSSNPGTNGRMLGSVFHKGSGFYTKAINFRNDYIAGWNYIQGDNSTQSAATTFNLGKTFAVNPDPILITPLGNLNSVPEKVADFNSATGVISAVLNKDVTTTQFTAYATIEYGYTVAVGTYYGFSWVAYGRYS